MSMDIRRFLQKKPQISKTKDDDDIIPESPDVQIQKKKKESRKKRVLSDSDDEISLKKNKSNDTSKPVLSRNGKKRSSQRSLKESQKISPQKLKEVSVIDLFGTSKIKRSEPLFKKKTETGIHSDDDFDKSLLELDENNEFSETATKTNHEPSKNRVHIKNETLNHVQESKIKEKSVDASDDNKKTKLIKDSDTRVNLEEHSKKRKRKLSNHRDSNEKLGIKPEFSVFLEEDHTHHDLNESRHKKRKSNLSFNESVLTDEEKHERKMHSHALYKNYLNRSGPKHHGAKEMPEGNTDCLKNCSFLLTGVLDSFEREEVVEAIVKFGGSVKNGISKKVTHVVAGEDAGPAKVAKAHELGIKIINEDEFLKLIIDLSRKDNIKEEKRNKTEDHKRHDRKPSKDKIDNRIKEKQIHNKEKDVVDSIKKVNKIKTEKSPVTERKENSPKVKHEKTVEVKDNHQILSSNGTTSSPRSNRDEAENLLWVEKYKPQNVKQIIGQHGDNSNVKKLSNWLTKWYANRKTKTSKPNPWAKNDDGAYFKAALLSGPPGVGKTTTVSLVCKELGFDMVEFNASDTRNKNLIKEQIGELLTTTSLSAYAKGATGKQAVTKKHVLVMDEVDGMSGNEDRGGMQELIALVKSSAVPVICTCNDRHSPKMKALLNYVFELKFQKPNVNQIKAALLSVCSREGVKIGAEALTQLIVSAGRDVRHALTALSLWAALPAGPAAPAAAAPAHGRPPTTNTDVKLGPWEAVRKVFTESEHRHMSINDKSDLFFYDYSIAPLFVQENYLSVQPHCPKHEILERVSKAADSISMGDIVDARIRGNQAWSLLPVQAMLSSVIPGHEMSGHLSAAIAFPGWLGKNSRAARVRRLAQELHARTRLSTSGSKSSMCLDYCTALRECVVGPLVAQRAEGVPVALAALAAYRLLRSDLDSLAELALWPGQRDPMALVDSKVKASLTRAYNKGPAHASAAPAPPSTLDLEGEGEEDPGEERESDTDPEADALITKKKSKVTENPTTSKNKPKASRIKKK